MGFRLVPKSVTLNDLERRNDRYLAFFSPNSVTSKWSKLDLNSLRRKCSPNDLLFSDISLTAIFAEVTAKERIIHIPARYTSTSRL